jgi:hypothetical protein
MVWLMTAQPKLYSYCIPYDDGAAPNPYWEVCTLVICKPVIRRTARAGDSIVGTGSKKSPVGDAADIRRRVGDCIYDFSVAPPARRLSAHSSLNRDVDLGGLYALLSEDFYYFGKNAPHLPDTLAGIMTHGQGHRSTANDSWVEPFVQWIRTLSPVSTGTPRCGRQANLVNVVHAAPRTMRSTSGWDVRKGHEQKMGRLPEHVSPTQKAHLPS